MLSKFINIQTETMPPITVGDNTVTPIARIVQVVWPGAEGGFFWARPVAVNVQYQTAPERILPITDPTRRIQVVLFLLTGLLLVWLMWHKKNL